MDGMWVCGGLWIAFAVVWLVWAIRTKPTQMREGVSSRLTYSVLTVAAFFSMFSGDVPRDWLRIRLFPANPWTAVLGVAITAAGLGFAVWARAYIGTNWSSSVTIKRGHELITGGPYSLVRHPIYTGLLTGFLGAAIAIARVSGLVAFALVFALFWFKLRLEERWMRIQFGEVYAQYAQRVPALVPLLPKIS